jgi:diguanylate cyclase (GGDEF)-like protein
MSSLSFVFSPGGFTLGIAVGVLGLILLLSLIIAYAYDERTLLGLAIYMTLMVAATLIGQRMSVSDDLVENLLLVAGPALLMAMQYRLFKDRHTTRFTAGALALVVLSTAGLLVFYAAFDVAALEAGLTLGWVVVMLGFSVYLVVQSWQAAGPWKWWLLLGQTGGLAVALCFLIDLADARQPYWSVVFMLLVQVPPTYLSLVWRSRLLNESRLRSASAATTDPLTGLATTAVMVERVMRVMSRAHQTSTSSALFLIEVRNWQGLLNQLGSEFDEKMLLESAMRLRRSIGDNDLAARLSGGRFAVIAQGLENEAEINALAMRLVVSGLRIDSPLLPGIEFQFRVLVSNLKLSRPLPLAETELWLKQLAEYFRQWPGKYRNRSILTVTEEDVARMVLESDST